MHQRESQREVLKTVASALKAGSVPFALAGSYAAWARGAPEGEHDVDFVVRPDDVPAAQSALALAGLEQHEAPEDWLFKVTTDGVMVDVIHNLPTGAVDEALLSRAEEMSVESVVMPVLSATDLLVCKLLVLNDHACDLAPPLALARALREQVDWRSVVNATSGHPFATAFLRLAADLDIMTWRPDDFAA